MSAVACPSWCVADEAEHAATLADVEAPVAVHASDWSTVRLLGPESGAEPAVTGEVGLQVDRVDVPGQVGELRLWIETETYCLDDAERLARAILAAVAAVRGTRSASTPGGAR